MAQLFLGKLLKDARLRRRITQADVASVLGMSRGNYTQIESGKRKSVVFEPERAKAVCRLLEIEMLDLVLAMGYPVKIPDLDDPRDAALLDAFHKQSPSTQVFLLQGLGVETE